MLSREDFYMIKQMRQQGAYIVDIAAQIGCSERTVRRYLKYPEPPARKTRHKMVKLKPFMDYIDMRLFVRYRRFDSFTHVNQQLEQWIADVADKRELRQFKETPEQRFALEQEHLQPLPDTDFDTSYFDIRHVSWDSYIEVGGNRYSVPEALCGQPVSIRISLDDELRIYSNEKLVASHRLCSASSGWQTVPEHHATLWQQVSQVEHR
ncbi:IS21 family transposase, partial [Escherichia coli]